LVLDIIKDYIDRKAVEHIVVARESWSDLYSALCDVLNWWCYRRLFMFVEDWTIPDELLAALLMK
jgi:hypothetical protein